jgi:hypothetical protein
VAQDPTFDDTGVYLGGYYTALGAGIYDASRCADELYSALCRPDLPHAGTVIEHTRLMFVCHSTGGIIVRLMLVDNAAALLLKPLVSC